MNPIRSRDNPQYKLLNKLATSSRERRQSKMTLLDGEKLIVSYRDTAQTAHILAISETAYAESEQRALFEEVSADNRLLITDQLLKAVSQVVTTTGLIAIVRIPEPASWPDNPGTCLLLEDIQDPGNLGTLLRTSAAAGVKHIALSKGCASAWAPKVLRAGMGANFLLHIHESADLVEIARGFKGKTIATQPRAEKTLYAADLSEPVAWLFGNEGAGLSGELLQTSTEKVRVPMSGATESMNITAAAAVCLFEQLRQISVKKYGVNFQ